MLLLCRKWAIHPKISKLAIDNFLTELLINYQKTFILQHIAHSGVTSPQYLSPHRKPLVRG